MQVEMGSVGGNSSSPTYQEALLPWEGARGAVTEVGGLNWEKLYIWGMHTVFLASSPAVALPVPCLQHWLLLVPLPSAGAGTTLQPLPSVL